MSEEYGFINRMAVVAKLAEKDPGLGRTKLMKYMYLLQIAKSVPLGYRFKLYAYGPYDSTVLNDLGMAEVWEAVAEKVVQNANGYGYEIKPGAKAAELIENSKEFLDQHSEAINWVIENFRTYPAAGMELIGTMVWADREASRAGEMRTKDELIELVLAIKPRFSKDQADQIAEKLQQLNLLVATT